MLKSHSLKNDNPVGLLHSAMNKLIQGTQTLQEFEKLLSENKSHIDAPNIAGITLLHLAAMFDLIDVAKLLLESGAQIAIQDKNGNTPFHDAHSSEMATLLAEHNAPLLIQNNEGYTPLHTYYSRTYFKVDNTFNLDKIAHLLKKTDQINLQDRDGYSLLHIAIKYNKIELVNILLKNEHLHINLQDKEGYTPLDLAIKNFSLEDNNHLIVLLLLAHHASLTPGKIDISTLKPTNLAKLIQLLTFPQYLNTAGSLWVMENPELCSYLQWLPAEIIADTLSLISPKFYVQCLEKIAQTGGLPWIELINKLLVTESNAFELSKEWESSFQPLHLPNGIMGVPEENEPGYRIFGLLADRPQDGFMLGQNAGDVESDGYTDIVIGPPRY